MPKIGLYTGTTDDPVEPAALGPGHPRQQRALRATAVQGERPRFCEALHDLGVKLGAAGLELVIPVTSGRADQATAAASTRSGFTAFINPGSTIAVTNADPARSTPPGKSLQKFINDGGNYVGTNSGGASAARSLGADRAGQRHRRSSTRAC